MTEKQEEKLAVIQTGGKQYKVFLGQKLLVEKIEGQKGDLINFDKVLLFKEGENIEIGQPFLNNHQVKAEILRQVKDKKKIVFKYHSKTRYRKKKGHRQLLTEIRIKDIL